MWSLLWIHIQKRGSMLLSYINSISLQDWFLIRIWHLTISSCQLGNKDFGQVWLYEIIFGRLQVIGVWKRCKYIILFYDQSFCFHFLSESSKGGLVLGVNLPIELLCWEVNQGLQSIKSTTTFFPI